MRVICFCGTRFDSDQDLAACPKCHEPAVLPQTTDADLEAMERELNLILKYPGLADNE